MDNKTIKPNFLGLIPFLIFVAVYLGTGIILNSQGVDMAFYQLPGPIAVIVGIVFAFIMFKGNIEEKFNTFLEGCGHKDIITMCVIYLLAGAFATVSKSIGGVDSAVNIGLTYIPPQFIAAGLFIISSFISTATGTSVGSIVAITPIAIGLADKSGVSLVIILAAVLSGSMFGDNLSIISDTTIAATKTQDVNMKDKFRVNLYIAVPAAILTAILLLILGRPETIVEISEYSYNFVTVIPYIFVLVLAIIGVNVFAVLTFGTILSGAIGLYNGTFTLLTFSNEVYNGFMGMNEIFLLSLLTGGLAALVTKQGGLQWVIEKIQKSIVGKKSAKLGIAALVTLTDMAVANNTVAIIIDGSIAKNISEQYGVDRRETAAILDIFSCIAQGIIPYGAQMLILLSFTQNKVSPLDLIPFLWYQGLLLIFTVLYIYLPIGEKLTARLGKIQ